MEALHVKIGLSSDQEIIRKILDGETALFEVLIRRYNSVLYKIARSYGMNHEDAEDMMQEAHFSAYTQLHAFREEASYKTWLTKILLHKCYHKRNTGPQKFTWTDRIPEESQSIRNKQDTEKQVLNKELAIVLEKALMQLPMIYRTVFVLREMEGFSIAETAKLLNISETNVKVRLNRAKALLQKGIEKFYSSSELFEFNLIYCDAVVKRVFDRICNFHG